MLLQHITEKPLVKIYCVIGLMVIIINKEDVWYYVIAHSFTVTINDMHID